MADKRLNRQIEIERNPVERALLSAKDFARNNKKPLRIGALSLLAAIVLGIAVFVLIDLKLERNQRELEKLLVRYEKAVARGDDRELDAFVTEAQKFIDSTWFGTAHRMGYYIQGDVLYRQKKYPQAAEKYRTFAKSNSRSSILTPLAYLKSAAAYEEASKLGEAEKLYRKLEEDFDDRATAELVYYSYARLLSKKNDPRGARKYYNKVIQMYPDSPLAEKAKKRLFLLSAGVMGTPQKSN